MIRYLLLTFFLYAAQAQGGLIDITKGHVKWTGTKITGKHNGKISIKGDTLKLENGEIARGEIVVDMKTISVEDLDGDWATKFLNHMRSDDFFSVEKFPTSILTINKVEKGLIHGNLMIKGRTHPVKFPYTKKDKTYSGSLTFDRTKYKITYGSGSFFDNLGDKVIHDEVTLDYQIHLK